MNLANILHSDLDFAITIDLLPLFLLFIWIQIRILRKAGFSGWWSLLVLVPIINIIMMGVFAFSDWPNLRKSRAA